VSQTVPEDPTGSASLQFDRAEFSGAPASASCTACQRAIVRQYYEVNGAVVCTDCRHQLTRSETEGSGLRRFARALVAGTAAGALGSLVYFGISKLTGYEFGLISILVGLGVGGAVRWGCYGRGGKLYQALAVALTYLAIVSTYVPDVIEGLKGVGDEQRVAAASAEPGVAAVADKSTTQSESDAPPTLGRLFVALAFVMFVACAAPFLGGVENLMGLAIIGFGLWEAWKINKRTELTITGPHRLAVASAPMAPPPLPAA